VKRLVAVLMLASGLLVAGGANATQQCFYQSGTVGSINVTRTCSGTTSNYNQNFDGIPGSVLLSSVGASCTFSFSPSVSTSTNSIQSQLMALNTTESVTFSINGSSYTLSAGDINNSLNPPTPQSAQMVLGSSNDVTSTGPLYANGTVIFNNAPSSVSSVTLTAPTNGGGGVLATVCFGDPVTPAPSAVPSLSEWAQLLLALMTITLVGWHFHRERSY